MARHRRLLLGSVVLVVFFSMPTAAQWGGCGTSAEYAAPCDMSDDSGGGVPGGWQPCKRCVIADWEGSGNETPRCKNRDAYQSHWPEYSPCSVVTNCWSDAGLGTYCEIRCDGNPCYSV
jgi:hypothetical protein